MALSDDLKFKIGLTVVGLAVVYFGVGYMKRKVVAAIPKAVKDGAVAVGVMGEAAWDMVTDPLDTFGIVPADEGTSKQKWRIATEEEKNAGPLRNEGGMDFTLF